MLNEHYCFQHISINDDAIIRLIKGIVMIGLKTYCSDCLYPMRPIGCYTILGGFMIVGLFLPLLQGFCYWHHWHAINRPALLQESINESLPVVIFAIYIVNLLGA